jgi:putative tryptophan/tyrosine transport system substrate-binding protein
MQRREFIAALGSAVGWSSRALAQQPSVPVVGYLHAGAPEGSGALLTAFRKGLREAGYIEGSNVAIEYRWAFNEYGRLRELAVDLVRQRVSVISTQGALSAIAAKAATTTIPIVFNTGTDPIAAGLVASLNRPGGNLTGATTIGAELVPKQFELLHEMLPRAERFAVLVNPDLTFEAATIPGAQAAAAVISKQVEVFNARNNSEIGAVVADLVQKRSEAIVVAPAQVFFNSRVQLITLLTRHHLAAIFPERGYVEAGGLMSYGAILTDQFLQTPGFYTGRLLKGEKPADLPVVRPARFEFVINLKTAKALGLTIPETLLATADEVIQ